MLVFVEGGKPENPEKNPWSRDENKQQTQPTYDIGSGNQTRPTVVGGKGSDYCTIPASPVICCLFVSVTQCCEFLANRDATKML